MKKITAFIKTGSNEIFFRDPLITLPNSTMVIKNISIYWYHKNVVENVNDEIVSGVDRPSGTSIKFEEGYWTFDMIKKKLESYKIRLERLPHNGTCKVYPVGSDLHLRKFAPLLGFPETENLTADVWESSGSPVDINQELRYVSIHCDAVNEFKNFNTRGERSSVAATIPITSEQLLNGSVTSYDIHSEVFVYNGSFNKLTFYVSTNIPRKVDMEVLFDVYIK